ncbi:hypothetical protein BGZ88_007803 [Linnemannia elongata]|nr:hypothetical protein BGZ88_007803 [Linnemannia elongata]
MSDDAMQGTLTYDQDIQDLPEDDNDTGNNSNDQPAPAGPLVTLLSLNTHAASIPLTRNKTILGRVAAKCTEGAVLDNPRISGTHCEVSSRSMTDADAAIWIKDTSSNGVWVNEKKISKNETVKIFDRDIVSFAAGPVDAKSDAPAFMLMDKRIKSASHKGTQQQQLQQTLPKRANDDLEDESTAADTEPEQKKQKTDDTVSAKDKEQEDNAFEQEFECGVCHEIMHKPMILQPCLHSFCRGCCKSWLKQSKVCPSCRQEVTRTKRDFKLNNLIALFLKTRPHMARDDLDEEEGGNDSDKSDLIGGERPRRRNRHYDYDDEDDEDEYDEDEDDDEDAVDHNLQPLPVGFQGLPVSCPCCLPNNNIGFTCPDGVRLEPLPANATFGDYYARLQPQPGHLQCPNCRKHLPVIPEAQIDIADRFRCKMCHVASCGCSAPSVDERAARVGFLESFLNPFEMQVVHEYMTTNNVTVQALWQEIKAGMDNGTFYYLGTDDVPNPPPAAVAAAAPAPAAANDAADATDDNAADPAAPAPAPTQDTPAMRAQGVKTSDRLCYTCARDFFGNGPIYQWRMALNDAVLPARAVGRSDCWYGRHCRTQHNLRNQGHAARLNHLCEKTHR